MSNVHKVLGIPRGFETAGDWLPQADAELARIVEKRIEIEVRLAAIRDEDGALSREEQRSGRAPSGAAPAARMAVMQRARELLGGLLPPPAHEQVDTAPIRDLRAKLREEREALEEAHRLLAEAEGPARRRAAEAAWQRAGEEYRRRALAVADAIADLARRHAELADLARPLGAVGAIPQALILPVAQVGDTLSRAPLRGVLGAFAEEAEKAGIRGNVTPLFAA